MDLPLNTVIEFRSLVINISCIIEKDNEYYYGPYLYNGCYDMSLKAVSIKNLAIINHNGNHYRVNFALMSKKDAYNLIKNSVIIYKEGTL